MTSCTFTVNGEIGGLPPDSAYSYYSPLLITAACSALLVLPFLAIILGHMDRHTLSLHWRGRLPASGHQAPTA